MSQERAKEIQDILVSYKDMESIILFRELLALRRKRHRDKLEAGENAEERGRSKECKDLLQLFG